MAMAISASSDSLPDLPEAPHQPTGIEFPKSAYGKKKIVRCSFRAVGLPCGHFYTDEAEDVVFCHTCVYIYVRTLNTLLGAVCNALKQ